MASTGKGFEHHDRLQKIEGLLRSEGSVRIVELADRFGVSEMTARRDLDELEAVGVARRVRGGAIAVGPKPFHERHQHNAKAKAKIAKKLARFIPDTGTICVDASSTAHRLVAGLDGAQDLLVVSNGQDVVRTLQGLPGIRAALTGGTVEPRTGSLVGPLAILTAEQFLYDLFVCSAAALTATSGSSEPSLAEADVKRSFAARSAKTILAVDSTKLGTRSRAQMFQLDNLYAMATDLDPTDERLEPYRTKVKII